MTTPRCFIIRHGETEWSLNGRHTGTSDIPLTANGEKRVRATGRALVGDDRLIVPKQLVHIFVSPRSRAQKTLELLDLGCHEPYPWQASNSHAPPPPPPPPSSSSLSTATNTTTARHTNATVTVTPDIREWDYGEYEGITSAEIRARREAAGLGTRPWDIWTDGCPGGESPADIIARVDRLIQHIRDTYHAPVIGKPKTNTTSSTSTTTTTTTNGDVLVVGHGHILRAFAIRWVGQPLNESHFLMEAGGVGTLSYEHHSLEEPAILLGGGFVVGEDKDKGEDDKEKTVS